MSSWFLDTLGNAAILLFWYRIWTDEDRAALFNPYLGPIHRFSRKALDFVRPVLFGLPDRAVALVAALFLLVFRGAIMLGTAGPERSGWPLRFGFEAAAVTGGGFLAHLLVSALSFAMLLFKLWGFTLLYAWGRGARGYDNAGQTIHHASRPFSLLRPDLKPLALLALGVLLAWSVNVSGAPLPASAGAAADWGRAPVPALAFRFAVSALREWIDILPIIRSLFILLIIGSWVSMFAGGGALMYACREWLDMLLGPARRYPLRIGMLDLTPLLMIFALQIVHRLLTQLLLHSYERLL